MASIDFQEVIKIVMRYCWEAAHFLAFYCWKYRLGVIGIAALLLIAHWAKKYKRAHAPIRAFSNEMGECFVSRSAIVKLIQSNLSKSTYGTLKRVVLKDRKRYLEIHVFMVLLSGQSFEHASSAFQTSVKSAVRDTLGEDKQCRISVFLDKVEQKCPCKELDNTDGGR